MRPGLSSLFSSWLWANYCTLVPFTHLLNRGMLSLVKHCDPMKSSVGVALYSELCHKNERIGNLLKQLF